MYYEINIAKKTGKKFPEYEHYFATAERSITSMKKLNEVYNVLKKAFPEPEFRMSATQWEKKGRGIAENEIHDI